MRAQSAFRWHKCPLESRMHGRGGSRLGESAMGASKRLVLAGRGEGAKVFETALRNNH